MWSKELLVGLAKGGGQVRTTHIFPISSLLVATNPKNIGQKKALASPFTTTHEGKLLITEEGEKGLILEQGELWSQSQTQNQSQCRSLSVSHAK